MRSVSWQGSYLYANEFRDIARKARPSSIVKTYLLGHAIELYLKSFLLAKGYDPKRLKGRGLGHNISSLLTECMNKGFGNHFRISSELKADIAEFSRSYADKDYEYFPLLQWTFRQQVPVLTKRVIAFATQLHKRLPDIIE